MRGSLTLLGITGILVILLSVPIFAADKPTFNLDWYGYFKLDGAMDQNLTSHGNFTMWVQPQSTDRNDEQFNMTANETRFGVVAKGKNYQNVNVTGKLEFDLYAGVTGATVAENKAMLQLRHAFFTVATANFKLTAGQTWDLISPLNPQTLNYPVLWGCGNIGYRRPQLSMSYTAEAGPQTSVEFATGFFRTIGSDLTPTFSLAVGESSEGSDDGTDAGIPTIQGRIDVKHKSASGASVRFGMSGLWGRLKAETNLGNSENYESRGVMGHIALSPSKQFGFLAEAYTGSNLGSYFGGILNSSTIDGVDSKGGWGSLWVVPTPKLRLNTGLGIDDPDDSDIMSGRTQNRCIFGNFRYSLVPEVTLGFEVSHWETRYKNSEAADNLRMQTSFILNF